MMILAWIIMIAGLVGLFYLSFNFGELRKLWELFRYRKLRGGFEEPTELTIERERLWMRFAISVPILISSLYIILFNDPGSEHQEWAYASIGAVIGNWSKL